jgi:hypothetical protein
MLLCLEILPGITENPELFCININLTKSFWNLSDRIRIFRKLSRLCSKTFINTENMMLCMKEKTLLRIALFVGLFGIITLFLISQRITPDEAMIGKLEQSVDETVFVTGSVVGVRSSDSTTFLQIQRDEVVTVVLFGKAPLVSEGDYIQVRGKVSEQGGELSIIGEEVRVI